MWKESEMGMKHNQFAEMYLDSGNKLFLNTEYITAYAYLKHQDQTIVSSLGVAKEMHFPGDQTEKIRVSFNCIKD